MLIPKEESGPRWVLPGFLASGIIIHRLRPAQNNPVLRSIYLVPFSFLYTGGKHSWEGELSCSMYKGLQSYCTPGCSPPLTLRPILSACSFYHRSSREITVIYRGAVRESSLMRLENDLQYLEIFRAGHLSFVEEQNEISSKFSGGTKVR